MSILVITHGLNALLMIAIGIRLGAYFTRRFRLPWGLYFVGSATFVLSQVGHIPFNGSVGLPPAVIIRLVEESPENLDNSRYSP